MERNRKKYGYPDQEEGSSMHEIREETSQSDSIPEESSGEDEQREDESDYPFFIDVF